MSTEEKAVQPSQREIFEKAAAEMFGADMQRGPYGNLLDRDSRFKEEYKFADVQAAWRMFQIGSQAAEAVNKELLEALERLEHNFNLLLSQKPVRDCSETLAEVRAVIAKARGIRGQ